MNAVESAGAYIPRYRITAETIESAWDNFRARDVREKRVAGFDEDAVTMAVEAARNALDASDTNRADVSALAFGTTTPPVEEGDIGVSVAEMLGLPSDTEVSVFGQSTRAGTRALTAAADADAPAISIAADCPLGPAGDAHDHAAGAGAVAFVTAPNGSVDIVDTASFAREYPGTRFRRRGSEYVESYGATAYERDAYTNAVSGAAERITGDPDAIALTAPNGSLPDRVARTLPVDADAANLAGELGDTGAASALFSLLGAWEDDATDALVIGYGDGAGADAILTDGRLDVAWRREPTDITYAEYLRKRGHVRSDGGEC